MTDEGVTLTDQEIQQVRDLTQEAIDLHTSRGMTFTVFDITDSVALSLKSLAYEKENDGNP